MTSVTPRALSSKRGLALAIAASISAAAAQAGAQPATQPATLSIDLAGGVQMELVLVRAGSFVQGSPDAERGRSNDETERRVTLSADYYIGKYPVTRGQFRRFTEAAEYRTEAERGTSGGSGWDGKALVQKPQFSWKNPGFSQTDDHPVVLVTHADSIAFAAWLSRVSERAVDLPTEAQWEYAARAGTKTRFFTGEGDENASLVGWHKGNAGQGTLPVGQKRANPWGLFDMGGNVWQWCRDFYGPYASGPVTDPLLASSPPSEDQPRRVLRGGSWLKDPKNLRPAARYRNTPGSRNADNGFRIVASVEKVAASSPAGPAAPGTPATPATPPSPGTGDPAGVFGGVGCCLMIVVLGGVLGAVVFALRGRIRHVGTGAGGAHGISLQPGVDGFWVRAPEHLKASTVVYRCTVAGRPQQGTVVLGGAPAQFVYTGATPQQLAVVQVVAATSPGGGWRSSRQSSSFEQHDPFGHHHAHRSYSHHQGSDSEPFQGYPSAY